MPTMLILGHGYSAGALASRLIARDWRVIGTTRSPGRIGEIAATGVEPVIWPGADLRPALEAASHLLISTPPGPDGDPVLAELGPDLAGHGFDWTGYLSTTGVYGDHGGGWVDEETPCTPATDRGAERVRAEAAWASTDLAPHIFRLAGIYGPGRGPFEKIRRGTARRIVKADQVFSRIHVDDIANTLEASIARPDPGRIYNVCDDDPAPPQDVIAEAARLLGAPMPPEVQFEAADLSPMARSFYAESKRVRNDRIKDELGVRLVHPDYRSGLAAILAAQSADPKETPWI